MAVGFSNTNKPINPRGNDASPKAFNRAKLYSGKALDFDGANDYVDLDGFTLSGTTATFSFAFNPDDLSVLRYFFDASDTRFIIGSGNTANYLTLYTPTSSFQDIAEVQTGEWYKLDISINGTSAACYLNGVLVNTLTIGAIDLSAATLAKFGSARNGAGLFYNGQASNFKIFNTALTAAQVADLYNNPEKVVPTGVANTALKLWLPMQEGAGTTAYDGSGNGNHGTISGATYTHGIGAPVSQTAVIDWNKGTNRFTYSERFDTGDWNKISTSVTANTLTAPDGQTTADSLNSTSSTEAIYQLAQVGVNSFSVYAKAGTTTSLQLASTTGFNGRGADFNLSNGTAGAVYEVGSGNSDITGGTSAIESVGNGWYRCSINGLTLTAIRAITIANNNGNLSYIWGASLEQSATAGPYVRTGATTQTSEVLLPQGLTTGRDITGVNLFENVRKQGALNLDGNSWAEVHDNASVDLTDAITLEAWVYWDDASNKGILGRWHSDSNNRNYLFYKNSATTINFYINSSAIASYASLNATKGWTHIVGTYNRTNAVLYIDGVQQATTAHTPAISTGTLPVEIGRNFTTSNQALTAPIAQPRIYNRALTAAEVLQNYNSGKNTYK